MECQKCVICDICVGGKLPHRYSLKNGFGNPSVYCKCIKSLIAHIQERLIKDIPNVMEKNNIKRVIDVL